MGVLIKKCSMLTQCYCGKESLALENWEFFCYSQVVAKCLLQKTAPLPADLNFYNKSQIKI